MRQTIQKLEDFFANRSDIKLAYLLGSYAANHVDEFSDLDISVEFMHAPSNVDGEMLQKRLEELFAPNIDLRVIKINSDKSVQYFSINKWNDPRKHFFPCYILKGHPTHFYERSHEEWREFGKKYLFDNIKILKKIKQETGNYFDSINEINGELFIVAKTLYKVLYFHHIYVEDKEELLLPCENDLNSNFLVNGRKIPFQNLILRKSFVDLGRKIEEIYF